jgi:hypothetical protein
MTSTTAFDELLALSKGLGGKHAAPKTDWGGDWKGSTEQRQRALIEQYEKHFASQLPSKPVPITEHSFVKLVESHFGPLSLIKLTEPENTVSG